ncbi:hypothetical protein BGY98DRAFT_1126174 [Russula aff. rugulosa BPL654]|nr:hypothetical protein BGY98DRAFT_1126174 [Russula aff. rugulosa BPL654]
MIRPHVQNQLYGENGEYSVLRRMRNGSALSTPRFSEFEILTTFCADIVYLHMDLNNKYSDPMNRLGGWGDYVTQAAVIIEGGLNESTERDGWSMFGAYVFAIGGWLANYAVTFSHVKLRFVGFFQSNVPLSGYCCCCIALHKTTRANSITSRHHGLPSLLLRPLDDDDRLWS